MAFRIVDDGRKIHLNFLTNNTGGEGWYSHKVGLFTAAHVILATTVLGDLTEAIWAGYSQQAITGLPAATLDGSNRAVSTPTALVFGNSSGSSQTAYGYFIVDSTNTYLIAADEFGAPITYPSGVSLSITLTLTYTSEF